MSHWALVWDCLLVYLYFDMAKHWQSDSREAGLAILASWMFLSKFLKLLGHYIRYPVDFLLLPVSILFGYFHGLIKGYAMLSLNVVSSSPLICHDSRGDYCGGKCTSNTVNRLHGEAEREPMTMTHTA